MTSLVELERTDSKAEIRFDRPERLNAVNLELLREFRDVLRELTAEPAEGVLLTGNGDVTSAGLDTDMVADPAYHEKYADEVNALNDEVYGMLADYPFPTVVAAKGALVGQSFLISLRCDLVVLGEETHFSLPEITYDISPATHVPLVTDVVGTRAATEIALLGEPIDPERAHNLGLVNAVVPEDEVEATARDMVSDVLEFDPEITRAIVDAT